MSEPEHDWERAAPICDGESTSRLKVPGGWLYRVEMWPVTGGTPYEVVSVALCFVPRPVQGGEAS